MKFSLCITTYNRTDLLYKSYEKIIDDRRINEVVICDDGSAPEIYQELKQNLTHKKIVLFGNEKNMGMLRNKREVIELATNDWCILLDSDNVIDPSYLDALNDVLLIPSTIFCPSFARPDFDFRKYSDTIIDKKKAAEMMKDRAGRVAFNTCNYIVNRSEYIRVWVPNDEMKGSDTIWFNYNWLKQGNDFFIVKNMEYDHLVHQGSTWLQDARYNIEKAKEIENLISKL